jgi:hypothetical protein
VTAIEPDRVVVLVGRDLRSTYQAIVQQAEQGDVTITKRDFEGFEAELSLTGADGEMEIELQPQPECDGATRAVVRSED